MANISFMMTLDKEIVNNWKQLARDRSAKEGKDYTFQDILREILIKAYSTQKGISK